MLYGFGRLGPVASSAFRYFACLLRKDIGINGLKLPFASVFATNSPIVIRSEILFGVESYIIPTLIAFGYKLIFLYLFEFIEDKTVHVLNHTRLQIRIGKLRNEPTYLAYEINNKSFRGTVIE